MQNRSPYPCQFPDSTNLNCNKNTSGVYCILYTCIYRKYFHLIHGFSFLQFFSSAITDKLLLPVLLMVIVLWAKSFSIGTPSVWNSQSYQCWSADLLHIAKCTWHTWTLCLVSVVHLRHMILYIYVLIDWLKCCRTKVLECRRFSRKFVNLYTSTKPTTLVWPYFKVTRIMVYVKYYQSLPFVVYYLSYKSK